MSTDRPDLDAGDEQAIVAFMQRLAAAPVPSSRSPLTIDSVRRQAPWRRRWEGERRMHVPLDIALPLEVAAGLAAAALVVFRVFPTLLTVTLHGLR